MKKRFWYITTLLMVSFLVLSLTACHAGAGGDETDLPETSGEVTGVQTEEEKLVVIGEDGKCGFLIVRPDAASGVVKSSTTDLFLALKAIDDTVQVTTDWDRNPTKSDYEILIGATTRENEDFYVVDRELLGHDGYLIKVVGTKILISGGDDDSTAEAVRAFISMIPESGKMELGANFEICHSSAAFLDGISCGNVSIGEYEIVIPEGDAACAAAANLFRKNVFAASAVIMKPAVTQSSAAHKIIFSVSDSGDGVFSVKADGADLLVRGNVRTGIYRGVRDLFESINESGSPVDFSKGYETDYGTVVMYEDFGAKGDGKTDDLAAIAAAHNEANAKNLPVFANENAEYYIGGANTVVYIKTNVDWSCASIVIDDRTVVSRSTEVFNVACTYAAQAINVKTLKAGQTNIGVTLPGDCLVTAVNANVKQYIRSGGNQDSGASMTDVFLVHADGSVDPSTPILWDFDTVTSINARQIDTVPLYIKGGKITTIANAESSNYNYYYRGIRVYRSNVIVDGLEHRVTGEGATGAPYYGILIFHSTVNDEARNVLFTGHKTYKTIGSAGTSVSMGTYDITVTNSLGFTATNCSQTNDINDSTYWGVFASNYSKNITFDGCAFSRFDAHKGVYDVTLKNCSLGHQGINLIGHGTALIENCTIYSSTFVNLRSDYGSTWNGDLIIRNCVYIPKNGKAADAVIIGGSNTFNHDFGYPCYLPQNIVIDGLDIRTTNSNPPYLFANINSNWKSDSYTGAYPMVMTKSIKVRGITVANGKSLQISSNKFMFKGLTLEELN